MRKRLRKKLHIGEFRQMGLEMTFRVDFSEDEVLRSNGFFDQFCEALDRRQLCFGGIIAYSGGSSSIVVQGNGRYQSVTSDDAYHVTEWLLSQGIKEITTDTFDLWHGPLPSEEPSEKKCVP